MEITVPSTSSLCFYENDSYNCLAMESARTMDLEKLYSPSLWNNRSLSRDQILNYHLKFIRENSTRVEGAIPHQLNVPYGPTPRQKLDIFGTDLDNASPILVFIHGGYWQVKELGRHSYHFIAQHLYKNNIKTIFIGYDLCPDVTIPEIMSQVAAAAKKCFDYANRNGSRGVFFMGHSAGGQLVGSLLSQFVIKGAFLVSGVFDLLPLIGTTNNEPLGLNGQLAAALSPMEMDLSPGMGSQVYCVVGEHESPEFIKQSKEFHRKLKRLGFRTELVVVDDADHYNIIELLSKEDYAVVKLLVKVINKL